MGRPSQGIDKALLKAGVEEITEKGVRGISVRTICSRAGVSLRMLNYYFGSKDNFIRLVLTSNYESFITALRQVSEGPGTALERLRGCVLTSIEFARENRGMARSLWMDAHAGDTLVLDIMAQQCPSHNGLMLNLIIEAQEKDEIRQDIQASRIFMALMPGIFIFNLFADGLLPMDKSMIPPEHFPMVDDPVAAAAENFDCLIEGYTIAPRSDSPTRATLTAAARSRKLSKVKKKTRPFSCGQQGNQQGSQHAGRQAVPPPGQANGKAD